MGAVHLVPLEEYRSIHPGCPAETRECVEAVARERWCRQAAASGLAPAWPSVVVTVTPWGVHVRGLLWRPVLYVEATPAP